MYDHEASWKDSPAITGMVLLILLISPLGAPMVALATAPTCGIEAGQCILPDAIMEYFILCALGPLFWFGNGGFVWLALSFASVVTLGWFFVRASFERVFGV